MQKATGIRHQTTWKKQRTACNGQQATRQETPRQHAADSRHCAKDSNQQAAHATDNVHQTADDMQEDASTCEMQQETHATAAFRVRRAGAAHNQQHARSIVLDNQVRKMAQTPHTRCSTDL
jgi:hypothetical protein